MRDFIYEALTDDEQLRTGVIAAENAAAALAELESRGLSVLLIRQADSLRAMPVGEAAEPVALFEAHGESLLDERVAQLLENRESLAPALRALADELPRGRSRRELTNLSRRMLSGATTKELTEPPLLVDVWLPLVGGGATTGTGYMNNVLNEAERTFANRAQVARSLVYPVTVLLMALGVLVLLGSTVVPAFREIYDDFGLSLPSITRLVLGFSSLLLERPLELLVSTLFIAAIAYGGIYALRHWLLPSRWFGTLLDGNSVQVSEMAVFVRRLAEALNAGLAPSDALLLAGNSSKDGWIRRESSRLARGLVRGNPSGQVLRGSSLPATVVHALQAGPEGAPHVPLLQAIADGYFERVNNRFNWAVGFWPQLAILFVGVVVLVVVLSLYLPLITLINGLT